MLIIQLQPGRDENIPLVWVVGNLTAVVGVVEVALFGTFVTDNIRNTYNHGYNHVSLLVSPMVVYVYGLGIGRIRDVGSTLSSIETFNANKWSRREETT